MQKSGSFIGSGLSELRNALSSPGDQLYQHLTDLILALDEAGAGVGESNSAIKSTVSRIEENSKNNLSQRANTNVVQGTRNGVANFSNVMDTSGPSRKKVRRKRRRRRSDTLPVTSWTPFLNGANANNSISHPSATEFCVSHSPINCTSDSSFDEGGQPAVAKNTHMDVSDSDLERLANKGSPVVVSNAVAASTPNHGSDWYQFRAPNRRYPIYPDVTMLSPMWVTAPIESDSFTETVTPARHSHQRRKRLIKRMAVDQPTGEMILFDDSKIRQNVSMDVDASPRCARATVFACNSGSSQRPGGSYSENSIEYDARSCLSTSDTDGNSSSDDGRQGDDELSDWCFECNLNNAEAIGDECMGVPNLKQSMQLTCPKSSNMESSDTDMSQSSSSQPSRRLLSKSGASLCGALNRRVLQFLRDPSETELSLGELRKKERKEALRLAMFYHLDVRREATSGCRYHVLCKTKYSRWPD